MPPMSGTFDATNIAPRQLGESHPVGKFPFVVGNTACVENKEKTGGFFQVDFDTPVGSIPMRYNLWNPSAKAVEIAQGQLAALCYATGVFRLPFENEGAAMRGAVGMIEVGYQKGQEPTPEKPHGGYTEVKKVYDKNGNEPGKPPQQQGQTVQQQPIAQQAASGWSNAPGANATKSVEAAAPTGWAQGGNAASAAKPPWAS